MSDDETCHACRHPRERHYGQWCRVPTGAVNAQGSALICCCEAVDRIPVGLGDDYWGRTPTEAMEKLKRRNPDYDHKPYPAELPMSFPVDFAPDCGTCGGTLRLVGMSNYGPSFTHDAPQA